MKVAKGQIYENTHDVMRRSLTIHDIIGEWVIVTYWVYENNELVLQSFTRKIGALEQYKHWNLISGVP